MEATNSFDTLARLFREHIAKYRLKIIGIVICMLFISSSSAINTYMLKYIIDDILVDKNKEMLYLVPIAIVAVSFIKGVSEFFHSFLMKMLCERVVTDIQIRLYYHLIYADIKYLINQSSGHLISKFTNELHILRRVVNDSFTSSFKHVFSAIAYLGIMCICDWKLTLIAILVVPIAIIPLIRWGKKIKIVICSMQNELGEFALRLHETFQNVKTIKSYNREDYEYDRARGVIKKILSLYRKAAAIESAPSPLVELTMGIITALIVLYAGGQIMHNNITAGTFVTFISAMIQLYRPLKALSFLHTSIQEGAAVTRRLFCIFDIKQEIIDGDIAEISNFDIELKNVKFGYGGDNIINDISMKIEEGESIALVGISGSGKTTIFSLLQRLYDANDGEILIGGHNIKSLNIKTLRSVLSYVSQDIELFDDTVLANIKYGDLNATGDDVISAAIASDAHDFIEKLPHGYHTQIGKHGVKLSGGQRQRIAIARALIKNSPILLLDEATSALDSISEANIQRAIENLKHGRTTLTIAHRLSTIELSDKIYVLSNGRVIDSGSHEELLDKRGEYYNIYINYGMSGDADIE